MEEDSKLVKNLSKGNILAFNTLFRKYSSHLYRFAFGYLKSKEETEELVQEVFTKIWENHTNLKKELSFRSYIFTIAFNIIRKHFRTRNYISKYFNTEIFNDIDLHTSQEITCNSLHDYILDLVNKLPEKRKEIFVKSRFEGLSVKDIAEEMGISHKTVENQLTNALKFIRNNFNRENFLSFLVLALIFMIK
jgi:RNA polymerase sigma-70 factor (ECF subfamily)